jgi:cell surface protein SprA
MPLFRNKSQKRKALPYKGGSQTQNFSISSDGYEDFRHFLLTQTFRNNYNTALKNFPVIQSLIISIRIEVWITNKTGATENARDVVAFQDLGEPSPYRTTFFKPSTGKPDNNSNTLYTQVIQSQEVEILAM